MQTNVLPISGLQIFLGLLVPECYLAIIWGRKSVVYSYSLCHRVTAFLEVSANALALCTRLANSTIFMDTATVESRRRPTL